MNEKGEPKIAGLIDVKDSILIAKILALLLRWVQKVNPTCHLLELHYGILF